MRIEREAPVNLFCMGKAVNDFPLYREYKNRPKRILVTSTSEVYGTARYVPINENHVRY